MTKIDFDKIIEATRTYTPTAPHNKCTRPELAEIVCDAVETNAARGGYTVPADFRDRMLAAARGVRA